jgi:hypothetical protein
MMVFVAASLASSVLAQNAGLNDEEVQAAINAAKHQKFASMFVEAKGRFAAYYSVLLQGPVGRTMDLAREGFESYKPLQPWDVRPEVRAHEVTFAVIKHGGNQTIKNVVVLPPGTTSPDAAIQPLRRSFLQVAEKRPRTWRPRLGNDVGATRFYRFAEDALPLGDFQILIVTDYGEERYSVKAQERDLIR